jgi:hypothetical protein
MSRTFVLAPLFAGLSLAGGAALAATPQPLYGNYTDAYGQTAAVATTPGTTRDPRSGFVVAAIIDSVGGLEVKGWQDTTTALNEVGHKHVDTSTIGVTAAAGLDPSHVEVADVDNNGDLSLQTWTVGTGGVAQLNQYTAPGVANPVLGMVALTATEVVTAYQSSPQGDLTLQAWTVSDTTAAPEMVGAAANGGPALQIAIAAIDSATVMTAVVVQEGNSNDLQVATWGVDATGVQLLDRKTVPGVAESLFPGVAIGAATVETESSVGPVTSLKLTREAFTPILNPNNNVVIEVFDWQISSTGAITKVGAKIGDPAAASDIAFAVAGCMLPTGVPMTVYANGPLPSSTENDITVGWFEADLTSLYTELNGGPGVSYVTATSEGDDFSVLNPYLPVHAYFVTGAMTATDSTAATGESLFKLQVWSYPITLPLL